MPCVQHSGVCVKLEAMERQCDNLFKAVAEQRTRIEKIINYQSVAGVRGDGGMLGDHEERLDKLEAERDEHRKATNKIAIQLAVAAISGGGIATMAGHFLLKFIGQ